MALSDFHYTIKADVTLEVQLQPEEWVEMHDLFFMQYGRSWTKAEERARIRGAALDKLSEITRVDGVHQHEGALVTVEVL